MMTNVPPETGRVLPFKNHKIDRVIGPADYEPEAAPIDVGGDGPHPPEMDIGERLARLEAGQDWIKVILALLGAVVIGGFAFLGVQINRIDAKVDGLSASLGTRIDAQGAQTRQELVGIANAISNSITAARQVQPQIVIVPTPVPGTPTQAPNSPPKR
jgi:hypothetical protein